LKEPSLIMCLFGANCEYRESLVSCRSKWQGFGRLLT
jgi:hypothetical protein